jgi:hypothetical protein
VELSHDQPGAEALFDQALTNGLTAIVAHEWPGEEKDAKGFTRSARDLLKIIQSKVNEDGATGVHVIAEPELDPETKAHWQKMLCEEGEELPPWTPASTSAHSCTASTSPSLPATPGDPERWSADTSMPYSLRTTIRACSRSAGACGPGWLNAREEDRHSIARAVAFLERIGDDEADRRASEAENPNPYHPKHNPDGADLEECPVCGREAFSDGFDDRGYGFSCGQCLVCTYTRSSAVVDDMAFDHAVAYQASND